MRFSSAQSEFAAEMPVYPASSSRQPRGSVGLLPRRIVLTGAHSMLKKSLAIWAMGAVLIAASGATRADAGPTLHQVYQAAQSGRLDQAQAMMNQVLQAHPNSAKAHFVEAEILAKAGRLGRAGVELAAAQRLEPGLPFAKPQAVAALSSRIAAPQATPFASGGVPLQRPAPSLPWGLILLGVGVLAMLVWFVRSMRRSAAPLAMGGGMMGGGMMGGAPGMAGQPYMGGVSPGGVFGGGLGGGGLGSGIVSGLATGAAVGAGMVAGEALVNHFMHGNSNPLGAVDPALGGQTGWDAQPDDMGGNDFGVSDPGSWDDGSGLADNMDVGGNDWS
jgi:hypothetical protein